MINQEWMGVADCNGVESFMKIDDGTVWNQLVMRATANQERFAVAFRITLPKTQSDKVLKLLKLSEEEACEYLHTATKFIGFPDDYHGQFVENWKKIPNKKLDPYGGSA